MATNAKVSLWDNSTQGLDSTTSIRFGNSLHTYTKQGRNIAAAALYQASDDLVHLFDKVTILYEGRQVFFGNINDAGEYFISLGFKWAERQSLSEFLISVTDASVRIAMEGWEDRVPRSPDDFVKCWKESQYYGKLQEELELLITPVTVKNRAELSGPQGQITVRKAPPMKASYSLSWGLQL
jgi:ABC-type multidrug transport system ATPase subunit